MHLGIISEQTVVLLGLFGVLIPHQARERIIPVCGIYLRISRIPLDFFSMDSRNSYRAEIALPSMSQLAPTSNDFCCEYSGSIIS
jgi:hypothetical protein